MARCLSVLVLVVHDAASRVAYLFRRALKLLKHVARFGMAFMRMVPGGVIVYLTSRRTADSAKFGVGHEIVSAFTSSFHWFLFAAPKPANVVAHA